jgi:hypothetical protein
VAHRATPARHPPIAVGFEKGPCRRLLHSGTRTIASHPYAPVRRHVNHFVNKILRNTYLVLASELDEKYVIDFRPQAAPGCYARACLPVPPTPPVVGQADEFVPAS